MTPLSDGTPLMVIPDAGTVAIVFCNEAFTFQPGHRMRAANCLVCGQAIGGQRAAVVGAAALAGEACRCGGIVSDLFLLHADHLPMAPTELQAAISGGLQCGRVHQ